MVGAPVWPNGVTLAAEAALTVTAEAASAAAPVSIFRRSRPPPLPSVLGKVSGVVMISSHGFCCWDGNREPRIRRNAGGRAVSGRDAAFMPLRRNRGPYQTPASGTAPALQRTASQGLRAALR